MIKKILLIINDLKSTVFSSENILKNLNDAYWILEVFQKRDKFNLSKINCKNIRAFVFGKNIKFLKKSLKNKLNLKIFLICKYDFKKIFSLINKKQSKNIIFFSPVLHHLIVLKILKIEANISINY